MKAQDMLATHPSVRGSVSRSLVDCIEACIECAQSCSSCADACLAEDAVEHLRHCVRLNLDCADICRTTAALLTRRTEPNASVVRATMELCVLACQVCADECMRHGERHAHCSLCAQSCRACYQACRVALPELDQAVSAH